MGRRKSRCHSAKFQSRTLADTLKSSSKSWNLSEEERATTQPSVARVLSPQLRCGRPRTPSRRRTAGWGRLAGSGREEARISVHDTHSKLAVRLYNLENIHTC